MGTCTRCKLQRIIAAHEKKMAEERLAKIMEAAAEAEAKAEEKAEAPVEEVPVAKKKSTKRVKAEEPEEIIVVEEPKEEIIKDEESKAE